MKLKSLRLQLPLTYAAIALLTTLVLGAVLLLTLRGYYRDQERRYLEENAQAMSSAVAQMVESGLPTGVLEAQIESLSFLTLARIRVWDTEKNLIVDSGVPDNIQITSLSGEEGSTQFFISEASAPHATTISEGELPSTEVVFVSGDTPKDGAISIQLEKMIDPASKKVELTGQLDVIGFVAPLGQSFYGFDLSSPATDIERSDQIANPPLVNSEGERIGSLELSAGPAYGREIVANVAQAWIVAGLLAVILAAVAGWMVSRRMVAPVLALTMVTGQMADGDLSARAEVDAPEELAALSHSFNEMAVRIEEMVSTLRNFVSDAAHELHTPLTALRLDLEMLSQAQRYSSAQIERALTQADRLKGLVDNLLYLSRIESQEHLYETVNLTGLFRELGELYASRAEQASLSFVLETSDTPAQVLGNELQLRSAMSNLLENAIKFIPEGGRVEMGLKKEGEGWQVWVEDDGVGIPPEEIPHLFQRFHRARDVADIPGNGLGLAIVKAIVDAHQGKVVVETLSPGARFSLWFPSRLSR